LLAFSLFLFAVPSPTASSPLSLHDALPICVLHPCKTEFLGFRTDERVARLGGQCSLIIRHGETFRLAASRHNLERENAQSERLLDRKSTRLNSSHVAISYAVFCLKKKKKKQ